MYTNCSSDEAADTDHLVSLIHLLCKSNNETEEKYGNQKANLQGTEPECTNDSNLSLRWHLQF